MNQHNFGLDYAIKLKDEYGVIYEIQQIKNCWLVWDLLT